MLPQYLGGNQIDKKNEDAAKNKFIHAVEWVLWVLKTNASSRDMQILFPFNGGRWFRTDVINNPIDTFDFIDNGIGSFL